MFTISINSKDIYRYVCYLKRARSDCFRFLSSFLRFWYKKKAHIFIINTGEISSWKMYRLEDINEDVTSYDNHN